MAPKRDEPFTNECIKCGHELKIELHAKAKLLYKLESVEKCTISTASCTNCLIPIYPNHYTYGKRGEDCFVTPIYNHLAVDPNYCEQQQAHSEELKKMFKKQQGVTASHVPQRTSTMKDVKPPTKSATTGVRTRSKAKKEEENKFEKDIDKRAFEGIQPNDLCNVHRDGITSSGKISSFGFLATFLNCKVIVGFDELLMAEGSE
ncbi:unnamed protein product [Didymodactylos carnosus]|uniref:Uncharacterized protein n=1 Tax=Didymodactylos carnosus TaxID=1234261 RepID=A0A814X4W4_9BILA|nr:unnamed protein product [Didymodactylos carnosus]CAF3973557.1 unnamed protein product [Didymodactylos carnosus]